MSFAVSFYNKFLQKALRQKNYYFLFCRVDSSKNERKFCMYEKSCELIYEMIQKRIALKRKKNPNAEKYSEIDPDTLNDICKNKRIPDSNPYLIPKQQIRPLWKGYEFISEKEMFFGNKKEVDSYAFSLFRQLLLDTIDLDFNEKRPKSKEIKNLLSPQKRELKISSIRDIVTSLTEYVPYAIYRMNKEWQFLYGENVKSTYDKTFDNLFETSLSETYEIPSNIVDNAIKLIFSYLGDTIKKAINEYFRKIGNTNRLNLKLSKFVDTVLVPIIRIETKENEVFYLGNNIYNTLTSLFEFIIENANKHKKLSDLQAYEELVGEDIKTRIKHSKPLFIAYVNLASELSRIQRSENMDYKIENNWTPELCLEPDEEDADISSIITTIKDENIDYDTMKNDATV